MGVDVKLFGAAGDGITLDHEAIQSAIDLCSRTGGGSVVVPKGVYLCGTIHLRSNVCLELEMGAVLLGVDDSGYYPEICKTPYGNLPGQIQALIWADGVENVSIIGQGRIDGGGNSALPPSVAAEVNFRPALLFFRDCKHVKFLDVTLQYSCFWTLHLMRCEEVMIRGITIAAHPERINTDGIDPDGCKNVIISDCSITTGDDCIVVKSTEGDACENITVTNCVLSSRHAALKIGTEAIGPIRNMTFRNCIIRETNVALALYMKDGSVYENMLFSGMVIEAYHEFPILVDITPRYYKEPKLGRIRNISFDYFIVTGKGRMLIEGAAGRPIENFNMKNITWNVADASSNRVQHPAVTTHSMKPSGARRVEIDPDRVNYAIQPYQFIAAHVDGLTLSDIRIYNRLSTDPNGLAERGSLYGAHVSGLNVERLVSDAAPLEIEPIKLFRDGFSLPS